MTPSTTTVTNSAARRKDDKPNGQKLHLSPAEEEAIETKYRDFFWTYTEEPHRTRRLAIIKAHPEVRQCLFISASGSNG
jgi:sphingolipid delta-4 desaturase